MDTTEFGPSQLGTRAHWDHVYEREVGNFHETGDEGEIWFGEDSVEKMVDWTLENVPAASGPQILEIGSGNGTLLFALRDAGYAASRLTGLDYSSDAVKLARLIAPTRNGEDISFSQKDELGRSPQAAYPAQASRLLKEGGYFLITLASFIKPESNFEFYSRVKHPSISFGGKIGSVYTTVAFKKIS
ncbi:S-adenosyl-L-methionine-dependent methyltransferase [Lactarius deliciosus]|nr:S-adenosyl-L-methionine-dependent methyltransferase [Lactarius deliciosus]